MRPLCTWRCPCSFLSSLRLHFSSYLAPQRTTLQTVGAESFCWGYKPYHVVSCTLSCTCTVCFHHIMSSRGAQAESMCDFSQTERPFIFGHPSWRWAHIRMQWGVEKSPSPYDFFLVTSCPFLWKVTLNQNLIPITYMPSLHPSNMSLCKSPPASPNGTAPTNTSSRCYQVNSLQYPTLSEETDPGMWCHLVL